MSVIVKDGEIIESEFDVAREEDAGPGQHNVLLPLAVYLKNLETLKGRNDVGVWLDSHEEVEELAPFLDSLPVIGLNFPVFHDGRSLSSATILRRRYGYPGEIRAIGDVRRDVVNQMYRCGFNAFEPAGDQTPEDIVTGLSGFTYAYQATIDRPRPLFRERA